MGAPSRKRGHRTDNNTLKGIQCVERDHISYHSLAEDESEFLDPRNWKLFARMLWA